MAAGKKKKFVAILAIVIMIAIASVVWIWDRHESEQNTLNLYGNVEIRQVDVAFNATERISTILAEEGDRVRKGQLLGAVDTERLQASVDRSRAQLQSQQQVLARLETGTRPQEIKKARADLQAAQARAREAEITLERVKSAVQKAAVSQEALDNALAQHSVAQAQLNAARETLSLAEEGPRQEDIEAAKAMLQAYRAELDISQRNLADANLISPSDGIIQNRILEPGDMASPQVPAYILALTDPIWIRVYVSEPDLGKIYPGMAAAVRTDSFPDKTYDAWVGYISPTAEFTPKSVETRSLRTSLVYQVRVYVKNPANELRLGMPVTVTIDLTEKADD